MSPNQQRQSVEVTPGTRKGLKGPLKASDVKALKKQTDNSARQYVSLHLSHDD